MRFARRLSLLAAVMAAVLVGAGAPANAAEPPANIHWLYTTTGSGAVFFDADLEGYPSYEKITVCDNRTDDRGIYALLEGVDPHGDGPTDYVYYEFSDPSNDGQCRSWATNYFADGYKVRAEVCEYHGEILEYCRWGSGVA
ncbi:hypothetical protein ACSNOB_16715 [Micromonospora sp. URMC 106]|jgi:hypothetical protein|uniref:hypothetical protein n=1 Tax=Micromonospora sp. URMC 106 TaxID=3423408 RepID=UPI003F1B459F